MNLTLFDPIFSAVAGVGVNYWTTSYSNFSIGCLMFDYFGVGFLFGLLGDFFSASSVTTGFFETGVAFLFGVTYTTGSSTVF